MPLAAIISQDWSETGWPRAEPPAVGGGLLPPTARRMRGRVALTMPLSIEASGVARATRGVPLPLSVEARGLARGTRALELPANWLERWQASVKSELAELDALVALLLDEDDEQ